MNIVTLDQESLDQGGFYVPRYEIHIEGAGLPGDVIRDVTQLTYTDDIKEIDRFELTVNNWDPATNRFKYVGSETTAALQADTKESKLYHLFEPSQKIVQVKMGYMNNLRVMLTGSFTTLEPHFPSSGAPTLTVRGLNVLHRLRTKQYNDTWSDKTDSEIAEKIDQLIDPETKKKRFPIPIQIDDTAKSKEPKLVYLAQKNQYDIDFLLARARQRGYVVFVQEADSAVRGSKYRLYFGPSDGRVPGLRDVTFKLEWGKSLIDFTPTLTTAHQVSAITVHSWDRNARKAITEKVTLDDPRLTRNRDLYDLIKKGDPKEEEVVDEPVFTKKQARERAIALLSDRQKEMVKASGTTIGLPDLRAGQRVQIRGLGARFNGTYFITGTTHTIGESGYTTRFEARREDGGKGGD